MSDGLETELGEQRVGAGTASGGGQVLLQLEHGEQVLPNGEAAKDARLLRQVAQAPLGARMHRQATELDAIEPHVAGVGSDQPDDEVEAGGLSGAVGPEEADDLSRADVEGDAVDHPPRAERLHQAFGFENAHGVFRCLSGWRRVVAFSTSSRSLPVTKVILVPRIRLGPWRASGLPVTTSTPRALS